MPGHMTLDYEGSKDLLIVTNTILIVLIVLLLLIFIFSYMKLNTYITLADILVEKAHYYGNLIVEAECIGVNFNETANII